jgi:hypothetical protein
MAASPTTDGGTVAHSAAPAAAWSCCGGSELAGRKHAYYEDKEKSCAR